MTRSVRPVWLAVLVLGCATATPEPLKPLEPSANADTGVEERRVIPLAKPLARVAVSPGDPAQGRFSLAEATHGVDGEGELSAELHTSMGRIDCDLYADRAPITVANFVGLARGVRPFRDGDAGWVKRPFFDGSVFHRVVPGFVIQAGAPPGRFDGGPGYVVPDEIWEGAKHDRAGLLCMANDGPDTGGSQFFILAGDSATQLDGSYTIFGSCFQTDVVDRISRVKAYGEKPAEPVALERVVIVRAPRW